MRSFLIAAAVVVASGPGVLAGDLSGTYTVRGTALDGTRYGGTAELTMSSADTCRMVWNTGGPPITGFCMWNGDTLAASYTMDKDVGIVIYRIKPDGVLDGVWTIADQDGLGAEVLIPEPAKP